MDTIDLHTHSTFSDGTFTPLQLVKYAEEKGLKAFALTDHDTTEGIKEAKSIETNVEVISGVEISTRYDKKEIHIVGLYVNENDADLNKQLKYYREKRVTRNFEILEKLNSLGVDITIDDVKESCTGDVISRAHIAKALVSKGFVGSYTEAFDRYLGDNKCAYVPRETLNYEESMELTKLYSVMGMLDGKEPLISRRPFREVHHTATRAALIGGGIVPRPGEISLAHSGILFLDELPEFKRSVLEVLRQPLEQRSIQITRTSGNYIFPADFMLVAAMNPCKCGYYPDMQRCTCTSAAIDRYLRKVSRPLLDRIDICVEVPQVRFRDLYNTGKSEKSEEIRARVVRTQEIQKMRYRGENFCFNSHIPSSQIFEYCKLDKKQEIYMEQMYDKLNLTARTYHKILRVARTLADMDESEQIKMSHLNEALCYRNIDKKFWEGMD